MSGGGAADANARCTLRRMIPGDLPAIVDIERVSFPSPWSLASFERELATAWSVPVVAVEPAPGGARLVGYACAWNVADEVQLLNVAVHPGRRRSGIGCVLVRWVQEHAVARRARAVILEVRVANVPARRLYARLGFRMTALRRSYYGAGQDGMLMEWRQAW